MKLGGHELHQCSFNFRYSIAFLFIPKNATTSIRTVCKTTDWMMYANCNNVNAQRIAVIIRNPKTRFLSALNMYLGDRPTPENFLSVDKNIMTTTDEHFIPQSRFLNGLDPDKLDYFYMGSGAEVDIVKDVMSYYGIRYMVSYDEDGSKRNITKQKIVTAVDDNIIRKMYQEDYQLIQSVEFKNNKPALWQAV
jgi:hypothetical protein